MKQQRSDNLASSLTECIDQIIATTPLIARLRSRQAFFRHDGEARWFMSTQPDLDCVEAADEIELLRKDAARYRWLRSDGLGHIDFEKLSTNTSDEGLDCAIDTAMAK